MTITRHVIKSRGLTTYKSIDLPVLKGSLFPFRIRQEIFHVIAEGVQVQKDITNPAAIRILVSKPRDVSRTDTSIFTDKRPKFRDHILRRFGLKELMPDSQWCLVLEIFRFLLNLRLKDLRNINFAQTP